MLADSSRRGFFGGIERHIGNGNSSATVLGVAGGHLHFAERPHIFSHLHHVLHFEFLDEIAVLIVAADSHERAEFAMDPDVNHLVAPDRAVGFIDSQFVARLAADLLVALQLGIGPVEEPHGEILVGEVGFGDGFDDFSSREIDGLAVDEFKQIEGVVVHAHVEDPQRATFFGELELDVLAPEEERDGGVGAVFLEVAAEAVFEAGEGCRDASPLKDLLGARFLSLGVGH